MDYAGSAQGMKEKTYLDGKTWLKYAISVWADITKSKEEKQVPHPAIFPISLAERLIDCYLWHKGVVLDPFMGSGTTLLAAKRKGHCGVGFDLVEKYCFLAAERLKDKSLFESEADVRIIQSPQHLVFTAGEQTFYIVNDDARKIREYLQPETVDLVITSPPYWVTLRRKKTLLRKNKIPQPYSEHPQDLGNISDYTEFINQLSNILSEIFIVLRTGARCAIIVKDIRVGSELIPFHADIILALRQIGFRLTDIFIWDRTKEYSSLSPAGYPYRFISLSVHEYIIVGEKIV